MKFQLHAMFLTFSLFSFLLPGVALAGYIEGAEAYAKHDYATAAREYKSSPATAASHYLGVMYATGQGVQQDLKESLKWHRIAAERGDAQYQVYLGDMYATGHDVPQNYAEAVVWYRRAAEQGDADGQSKLGSMFANGNGVPSSRVVAYALFSVSATNDSALENNALAKRAALTKSLSIQEIKVAKALTRELSKRDNLLIALDKYIQTSAVQ